MAIKYKMKDEFLAPYTARLNELEGIDNGGDPFVELDTIRKVWLLAREWLDDMQDSSKVYEIEE